MSSNYPASWRLSKIMPVAKTNDPGSLSDYRPICILPALSKAMEIIMRNQVTAQIERNGMMSRLQSGFRSNHSTITALLKITSDLLLVSEEKFISILVLLEFSKAFDSVDHQLLCLKLSCQYKFSTCAVELIRSFLCGRMQWVWIGNQASEILPVTSGVVQGSVLGPLLFSLFINDITSVIVSYRYHLYADEVQLYISCRPSDYVDCISRLNLDLDHILQWSSRNSLSNKRGQISGHGG
jgi:hypothetical protein